MINRALFREFYIRILKVVLGSLRLLLKSQANGLWINLLKGGGGLMLYVFLSLFFVVVVGYDFGVLTHKGGFQLLLINAF